MQIIIFLSAYFLYCTTATAQQDLQSKIYPSRTASLGIIGDTSDITTRTKAGTVLMGGGGDVDAAFKWLINRSGSGNAVIIRASGTAAYNRYVYNLGNISSVETLKIDSRELAEDDEVVRILRNAELLFIAGGDQSVYMKQWKGTKTADAINYLLNEKKIPVGGTSAGCAILSGFYYSGEGSSAQSKDVLQNPYHQTVTVYNNDFLHAPYLSNIISDQHYTARNRQGRHVVFLSRIYADWKVLPKGIAVDEKTAVAIDEKGKAVVFGTNHAYFISPTSAPERTAPAKPLHWMNSQRALWVFAIKGNEAGNGKVNIQKFKIKKPKNAEAGWWWVDEGILHQANSKQTRI